MEAKRTENINNNTNLRFNFCYLEISQKLLKSTTPSLSPKHAQTYLRGNKNNQKNYYGSRNMENA